MYLRLHGPWRPELTALGRRGTAARARGFERVPMASSVERSAGTSGARGTRGRRRSTSSAAAASGGGHGHDTGRVARGRARPGTVLEPRALLGHLAWDCAADGNPVFDLAFRPPSLHLEGGAPAQAVGDVSPGVVALVAGVFASRAGLPNIPVAPRVRGIQQQQLELALPWIASVLGLSPLDGRQAPGQRPTGGCITCQHSRVGPVVPRWAPHRCMG